MIAPCKDNIKFFICPTNATNYNMHTGTRNVVIDVFSVMAVYIAAMTMKTSITTCILEPEM